MSKEGISGEISEEQRLVRALETAAEILTSKKLEALSASITALESRLTERLDAMRKEAASLVERHERDEKQISSRLDELGRKLEGAEERHKTALGAVEERTREAETELRRDLDKVRGKAESQLRSAESALKKNLEASEQDLKKELGTLSAGLSGLQLEVQGQQESTERIAGLLKNAATVFSGQQPVPVEVTAPTMQSSAAATVQNLDTHLDQMFGPDGADAEDGPPDRDLEGPRGKSKKR